MLSHSLTIARIDGFDVKVDASWTLIATLIVWTLHTSVFPAELPSASPSTLMAMSILAMLGLFLSLIVHELAHSIVARHHGLSISGITLFLFGGIAELKTEPISGKSEFWIAIAGPIASLCIAAAFWFSAQVSDMAGLPAPAWLVLSYLAMLNLILALFNLIPAFPMDGGRLYRAWLWARSDDLLAATRRATAVSTGFAYAFIALGTFVTFSGNLISGLWPILIGLFLLAASHATLTRAETDAALKGRTVGDVMRRDLWTANADQTLSDLVYRVFLEHGVSFAPVTENGALLGYVDLPLVRKIDREHWGTATVDDVIESPGQHNTVPPEMPCGDLLARITKTGRRKFMVVGPKGLVGIVTLSDLLGSLNVVREVA